MSKEVPPYPQGKNILEGKMALVTASAGTGIGFATAKRCAEEGATVMLSDIHEGRLNEYAEALEKEIGRKVYRQLCDVRSEEQVDALITAAVSEMGGLDILVNNAGMGMTKQLIDTETQEWERLLDINLTGTFRAMRAALRYMQGANRGGVIINLSSICAWRAEAGQTAYAASKAGVLALTRCAAMEAADYGVRINAVVPSLALHPYLEKVSNADFLQELIERNEAFGRAAETWEIANTVVFLASEYASYMTGESLSVSCRRA
ncbi:SDR family oxidoreductase [Pseudomaricurvus alkylphenolicus]|uniref:SDR family oxidoreductase n=1 Tax=Pseudomaricurvus alkylphenolicus TaxID=1306991 RepID=UPI00141EA996|nr:SDR family oxidoreductase [Pseudomaricurvus alkylphenolicus]NIB40325.1 SDR family oxidoreductase [Pseudomaricurvus alkylphenolicus]